MDAKTLDTLAAPNHKQPPTIEQATIDTAADNRPEWLKQQIANAEAMRSAGKIVSSVGRKWRMALNVIVAASTTYRVPLEKADGKYATFIFVSGITDLLAQNYVQQNGATLSVARPRSVAGSITTVPVSGDQIAFVTGSGNAGSLMCIIHEHPELYSDG